MYSLKKLYTPSAFVGWFFPQVTKATCTIILKTIIYADCTFFMYRLYKLLIKKKKLYV